MSYSYRVKLGEIAAMTDRLKVMIHRLITVDEGGEVNDPLDSGGKTIFGISINNFPKDFKACYDLYKNHGKEAALEYAYDFYRRTFWNTLYYNIQDSSLCYMLFSFGVNGGMKKAVKILQKVLKAKYAPQIIVDGDFGERTLFAVNSNSTESLEGAKESELFYDYQAALEKYYRSLWNFFRFGKGWLNRVRRIFNYTPKKS